MRKSTPLGRIAEGKNITEKKPIQKKVTSNKEKIHRVLNFEESKQEGELDETDWTDKINSIHESIPRIPGLKEKSKNIELEDDEKKCIIV